MSKILTCSPAILVICFLLYEFVFDAFHWSKWAIANIDKQKIELSSSDLSEAYLLAQEKSLEIYDEFKFESLDISFENSEDIINKHGEIRFMFDGNNKGPHGYPYVYSSVTIDPYSKELSLIAAGSDVAENTYQNDFQYDFNSKQSIDSLVDYFVNNYNEILDDNIRLGIFYYDNDDWDYCVYKDDKTILEFEKEY